MRNTALVSRNTFKKDTHGEPDQYVTEKARNCNIFRKKGREKM